MVQNTPLLHNPWATICPQSDAPTAQGAEVGTGRVAYTMGLQPEERPTLPGYDSGVMAIVIGAFLILSLNFRHYSTFLKTFAQDLWNVRRRLNQSNAGNTVSETRIQLSLIFLACLTEGSLIFSVNNTSSANPATAPLAALGTTIAATTLYYIFQTIAYRVVGYTFNTPERAVQWLRGFNASQSLLGLALTIPALIALFNPDASLAMASAGATLYIIARIIFICKGFRLFYNNSASIVYFILYLCTLEVAPLLIICKTGYMTF